MKLSEILKIIKEKNLSEQFFGYNEYENILKYIKSNPKLLKKLEQLPDEYWEEVIKEGIIIFMDYTYQTADGTYEDLTTRHLDIIEENKHVPTLIYQRKRNRN